MSFSDTWKAVSNYGTALGLIVAVVSAYIAIDGHYAKVEAVRQLEMRIDQKILADRTEQLQQRIWAFENRYKTKDKAPKEVQDAWKMLERELAQLDYRLNKSINEVK